MKVKFKKLSKKIAAGFGADYKNHSINNDELIISTDLGNKTIKMKGDEPFISINDIKKKGLKKLNEIVSIGSTCSIISFENGEKFSIIEDVNYLEKIENYLIENNKTYNIKWYNNNCDEVDADDENADDFIITIN
jgi:hypothetical protein